MLTNSMKIKENEKIPLSEKFRWKNLCIVFVVIQAPMGMQWVRSNPIISL